MTQGCDLFRHPIRVIDLNYKIQFWDTSRRLISLDIWTGAHSDN